MTTLFDTKQSSPWIGKRITWETPAYRYIGSGQYDNKRSGLCLEYIAPGEQLYEIAEKYGWSNSQLKAGNGHGESVNPRLLVRVDRVGTKGQPLKPHYYAPRISSVLGEVK